MSIYENIQKIKSEVDESVTIVAVTKNRTVDEIKLVINNGITNIGENKWQEAREKMDSLPPFVTKHFIGHLQTNKVKDVVKHFDVIQSVDSLKLAKKISEECIKLDKTMPVMIQVNTSNEPQKSGISPSKALDLIDEASELSNVKVIGLMTIGVMSNDEKKVRKCFRLLKKLFDKTDAQYLSMGMSGDYKISLEEGANMIRIGSAIFV